MYFFGFPSILVAALLGSSLSLAVPTKQCTSAQRLAAARHIPYAYNLKDIGASAAAFEQIPFAHDCDVLLHANGLDAIKVASTALTTREFALRTRQLFSKVTGRYTDFKNGTTIIATNVTLGVAHLITVPVTFSANVFLTYDLANCEMNKIEAFATIPTRVLGLMINPLKP